MRTTTRTAVALSALMVLAVFGFAGTASADDKDDVDELVNDVFGLGETKKTKEHKTDKKIKYFSGGVLGDVATTCPGINGINRITVHDPQDPANSLLEIKFYAPGKKAADGDINIPITTGVNQGLFEGGDPDFCIGGAIGNLPQGTALDAWDIWAYDTVWDTLEQGLKEVDEDFDFKVAGLARMVASYDGFPKNDKDPTADPLGKGWSSCPVNFPASSGGIPGLGEPLVICLQSAVGNTAFSKNFNQFGFCGQGYTEDLVDPWSYFPADAKDPEVQKVVFADGIAFYLFDCANEDLATGVGGIYNTLVDLINDGMDPVPGLCEELDLICFFDFPVAPSRCYSDKSGLDNNPLNIAVPGILGTIGWNHNLDVDDGSALDKCEDPTNRDAEEENSFKGTELFGLWVPDLVIKESPSGPSGPGLITIEFDDGSTTTL